MRPLRRLFYPAPPAKNRFNYSVDSYRSEDETVKEGDLVRILDSGGNLVTVALRYGTRDGLPAFVGHGGLAMYIEQPDPSSL